MDSYQEKLSRRQFLSATAAGMTLAGVQGLAAESSMAKGSRRPNILFLFSDQQRWDTLGCYGQPLNVTPNLDRMAAEGVRFENAFTCQPVCGPARASLQTGRYAEEIGCFTNGRRLPAGEKTIAHHLSAGGYDVGYVGKWHLASDRGENDNFAVRAIPPDRRGGYKDFWLASDVLEFTSHSYDGHMYDQNIKRVEFPKDRYRVDCLTDFAIDYLRGRKSGKPFFLFISYIEPHFQNDHKQFEGPHGSKERWKGFVAPGDLAGQEGDWRESYPDYLGCCSSLDANVGRLRAELEKMGVADNTIIFYTSDHGCHFRTRNGEYKRSCHDSSIRVPLVACGPGWRGGRVVKELASLIDLPPTLLAAADAQPPATMRGKPLQQLLSGDTKGWPEEVYVQISESQVGRAIRTKRWKYSVHAPEKHGGVDPGSDVYVEQFLYDLSKDPHELTNLVSDPGFTATRRALAAILKKRSAAAGEEVPEIMPAPPVEA